MTPPLIDRIAAVNHPVRRRILDALALDGPATASQLAARLDQHVGNVSHHLRTMAKAGLVEEAPELARNRRERWWRSVPVSLSWSLADMRGDAAAETVAVAAEQVNLTHHAQKVRDWFGLRDDYDEAWTSAAFSTEAWVRATPQELAELGERLAAVIAEFKSAHAARPDDGREDVFVFAHGVPGRP
jgi:DNA-binding transcriptional ArsR family regulator